MAILSHSVAPSHGSHRQTPQPLWLPATWKREGTRMGGVQEGERGRSDSRALRVSQGRSWPRQQQRSERQGFPGADSREWRQDLGGGRWGTVHPRRASLTARTHSVCTHCTHGPMWSVRGGFHTATRPYHDKWHCQGPRGPLWQGVPGLTSEHTARAGSSGSPFTTLHPDLLP